MREYPNSYDTGEEMAKAETPEPIKAEIVPSNGNGSPFAAGIELATKQGNVEVLLKFFELQERIDAHNARKAFEQAFADFKGECPRVEKTKEVDFTTKSGIRVHYKYAPLDKIAEAVGPVLAKHGLSYNWKQTQTQGTISVTCILKHVQGHSESGSLEGPPDDSGSKNSLQAIKATVSYLRRGTLEGVLGMATGDEDTDGVTMAEAADFLTVISESSTIEELKKNYQLAIADGVKRQSPKFLALIFKARQQREAELRA